LVAALLLASSATIELTNANFKNEVVDSGKSSFIKFLA
jgi:hypothetical protein